MPLFSQILCYFAKCMKKYRVEVMEILSRTIEIEADCEMTSVEKVREMYQNCDLVLDDSDYIETKISVKS